MKTPLSWKGWALAGALTIGAPLAVSQEGGLTPDDLLQDGLNLSCISYRVSGICYWLKCTAFGCYILTSPQVEHYNPDAVSEVSNTDRLPMSWLTGPINNLTSGISSSMFGLSIGERRKEVASTNSYQFHDVNEIGNPVLPLVNASVGSMLSLVNWCGSQVTPLRPYFNSRVDPDWRLGLAEAVLTIPNLSKKVGTTEDMWAPVYPRTGAVVHSDLYRSSAGIAFRAGHITTRSAQPHIYSKLPTGSNGGKTWGPEPVVVDEDKAKPMNKWQLNYPKGERQGCYVFPDDTGVNSTSGEFNTIPSDIDNYVWTLWRKYKCCQQRGRFLYATEW